MTWYRHLEPDRPFGRWRWAPPLLRIARNLAKWEHEVGDRVAVTLR